MPLKQKNKKKKQNKNKKKTKQIGLYQTKQLFTANETINKIKRDLMKCEKIFSNHIYAKYMKNSYNSIWEKNNLITTWQSI